MITLNSDQRQAVDKALQFLDDPSENMFLIEGSAGTGKTTCIQTVIKERTDLEFVLSAPTNKATKVLREMSQREGVGEIECRTIYSLLGLRVQKDSEFIRVEPLAESDVTKYDVVVVDEGSMVNKSLSGFMYDAVLNCGTKFIVMLDPLQLPPVGEDNSELCSIPNKVVLSKVMRHDNQILTFANSLRECVLNGKSPNIVSDHDEGGGVYTVDSRRMRAQLEKAYSADSYLNNPASCKTIAWRNAAVNSYNNTIRNAIYGKEAASEMFVLDERVVATHPVPNLLDPNNFDMVTDEEGTIVELDIIDHPVFPDFKVYHLKVETEFNNIWADCFVVHPSSLKAYNARLNELSEAARARQIPWASFWKFKNEYFHDIRPCHAITAHRSQGSTYRAAFVDVSDILANYNQSEAMRCLYVAATRASNILVLKVR